MIGICVRVRDPLIPTSVPRLIASFTADEQIGIIAPYHAQCQKIRILIRSIGENIKVGSVEEFQGQVCFMHLCPLWRPTLTPLRRNDELSSSRLSVVAASSSSMI